MTTVRRKAVLSRARPAWIEHLLETHEPPDRDGDDKAAHSQFVKWFYLGESVPGLPDVRTAEGRRLASAIFERRAKDRET